MRPIIFVFGLPIGGFRVRLPSLRLKLLGFLILGGGGCHQAIRLGVGVAGQFLVDGQLLLLLAGCKQVEARPVRRPWSVTRGSHVVMRHEILRASALHTGLLWALEMLAWSPDHLTRATLLLGRLARIDPGGRSANRPAESLRSIFLSWHPQTAASVDQRFVAIDLLRQREPDVAWRLMRNMLPEGGTIATPTPVPRWRDWLVSSDQRPTRLEVHKVVSEVVERLQSPWLRSRASGSSANNSSAFCFLERTRSFDRQPAARIEWGSSNAGIRKVRCPAVEALW